MEVKMAWRRGWGWGEDWGYWRWRPYVSVGERQARARRALAKLEKKRGRKVEPVKIEGRTIARTFWGEAWCENLERYSDFENRLPRGRSYVRNGLVIDLQISRRKVNALVSGTEIYEVSVDFEPLKPSVWKAIKDQCAGKIDSLVELLEGRFSNAVMEILTAPETGLFPAPKEIKFRCTCPDWAYLCKHVAAALYGVGARLDDRPELLFVVRDVDPEELVTEAAKSAARAALPAEGEKLEKGDIERIFGIEIDASGTPAPDGAVAAPAAETSPRPRDRRKDRSRAREASGPSVVEARRPRLAAHFLERDTLTNAEYRELFGVSMPVATRELRALVDSGVLIQRGLKRGAHYLAGVELY